MKVFILLLFPLLFFGGYYIIYPMYQAYDLLTYTKERYERNQSLSLEIDTPDGPVTGHSVTRFNYDYFSDGSLVTEAGSTETRLTGEAVAVDLGGGKYLFALLKDMPRVRRLFRSEFPKGGSISDQIKALKNVDGPRPVPPEDYPLLVTFGDVSDPTSVVRVDPADLAAIFGAGFALREITMEVTDDAVTVGVVERVLGDSFFKRWGALHKEALARGLKDRYFGSLLSSLSRGDFIKGKVK